jgi:hypothetical protein
LLLDDLSTKRVPLDGSFIALAACGLQDSFADPAGSILKKQLAGIFADMQTYTDSDELTLGGAQVTFLHKDGDGIFTFNECVTVDTSSIDNAEINAVKQQHFMTRRVTQQMAAKIVGWVPPDPFTAVMTIRGFLVEILADAVSHSWIAPYGSEQSPPTRRKINPSADVLIFQDEQIKTDWVYEFFYNLRYVVKRTSGLYGIDSNAILRGAMAA